MSYSHDAHVARYKQYLATMYLGTRHILHSKHAGGVSHNPSEVNVARTVKRAQRDLAKAYDEAHAENQMRDVLPKNVEVLQKKAKAK